ncbi:Asp23/Gls24 family envelope stress response protein [Streptomyces nanshensis]|uniref:Stress protein n=1 Tax=Streptomyces nanshensis TaxID=518642 RepID=A0A1E7L753_9ACTN|nr:Asp23/Gls24 family envelope stress response protein [Streptomyces nanshensis]OEV12042.1 stress protein [Streptomyces nanshensis]
MADTKTGNRFESPGQGSRTASRDGAGENRRPKADAGERGRTTISDGVVEKIAGLAARDVPGVHALGSGIARTFGAMRDRVPGGSSRSPQRGVSAEVGDVQTALDLEIVVEYGVAIADLARSVRENVISAVERMAGLEVVEVNIAVSDVKLPDEEDEEEEQSSGRSRLQ